jgi:RNA polymerase sigma-70 factor, ECF subfamily
MSWIALRVAAGEAMPTRDGEARARAEAGSQAEELVQSTYRMIYSTLFRLTGGDAELAADLTQETYRKAWASLDGFAGRAQFSTWLYRIAYTTFLNHARRPRLFVPLDDGARLEAWRDPAPREDEELIDRETQERLRRAVLELPEELRFAVTAHYWQGVPIAEIAKLENISSVGIRKRIRRAVKRLALALSETRG